MEVVGVIIIGVGVESVTSCFSLLVLDKVFREDDRFLACPPRNAFNRLFASMASHKVYFFPLVLTFVVRSFRFVSFFVSSAAVKGNDVKWQQQSRSGRASTIVLSEVVALDAKKGITLALARWDTKALQHRSGKKGNERTD